MGDFTWTVVVALAGLAITVGGGAFKLASDNSSIRQLERIVEIIKVTKDDAADAADALAVLREVRGLHAKQLRANYSLGVKTREILKAIFYIIVAFVGIFASFLAYNSAVADPQFHPWLFWLRVLVVLNIAGGVMGIVYLIFAIVKKF